MGSIGSDRFAPLSSSAWVLARVPIKFCYVSTTQSFPQVNSIPSIFDGLPRLSSSTDSSIMPSTRLRSSLDGPIPMRSSTCVPITSGSHFFMSHST